MSAAPSTLAHANMGVGGAGSVHVLDNMKTDIPFSLHFEGGSGDAHVSGSTLAKMCGNVVPTQINPVALSFGSTSNMNSEAHFVTAHLGAPGSTAPLHTQGRDFHVSSTPSISGVEGTVNASHVTALPNGLWQRDLIRHSLTDLTGVHGKGHPSLGHVDAADAQTTAKGLRQAMSWSNSVNATMDDVMHGCVTAKSPNASEQPRVSIPLDGSMESSRKGQLAALCRRKQSELTSLVGAHHITSPMANPMIDGPHVPHVVVTADAAHAAATKLVQNLAGGALSNGMTFSCRDRNGNHPEKPVMVQCMMHRSPGKVSGVDLTEGQSLMTSHVAHLFDGEPRSTPADAAPLDTASATDALTAAMFDTSIKLPKATNGPAPAPATFAATDVVVHGSEAAAGGGVADGNISE